jgi:hypothetical protein
MVVGPMPGVDVPDTGRDPTDLTAHWRLGTSTKCGAR